MAERYGNHNDDLQELLNMLDRMQKRPAPAAEQPAPDDGAEELVQLTPEEPAAREVFDPEPPMVLLSDLLINPVELAEEEVAAQAPAQPEPTPEELDPPLPPAPAVGYNPLPALRTLLPSKRDNPLLRGVKWGTLAVAALALLSALLLVLEMAVLPWHNRRYNGKLADWYHTANASGVTRPNFPEGMRIAFNKLYRANDDVRGWITFRSLDGGKLVDIDYPVVQTDNNETYRNRDLHGRYSRFGTLFFDEYSRVEQDNEGSALVIYGNSDGSGQMLSDLNSLVGSVNQARLAPTLTLDNLYGRREYVVFAVLILDDEEPSDENRLELRNQFASSQDFLSYVAALRKRSLYDYPVGMMDTDRLLLLTTELNEGSDYGLKQGRVVVAARRRREGELTSNEGVIQKNVTALMPYRWYTHQGLTVPNSYFGVEEILPTDSTTTTTTTTTTITTVPTTTTTTTAWTPEPDTTPTREGITTTPEEATRTTRDYSQITGPNNVNKED